MLISIAAAKLAVASSISSSSSSSKSSLLQPLPAFITTWRKLEYHNWLKTLEIGVYQNGCAGFHTWNVSNKAALHCLLIRSPWSLLCTTYYPVCTRSFFIFHSFSGWQQLLSPNNGLCGYTTNRHVIKHHHYGTILNNKSDEINNKQQCCKIPHKPKTGLTHICVIWRNVTPHNSFLPSAH